MKKTLYLLILLTFVGSFVYGQTREFRGKLFLANTEIVIADASISVTGDMKFKTKTDSKGEFVIPKAVGTFKVKASKKNFVTFSQEIPADAKYLIMYMSVDPNFEGDVDQAFGQKTTKRANTNSPGEVKLTDASETTRDILSRFRTVPGVEVSPSGAITIRGTNSLNNVGPPLLILDGSPFNGDITSLNPDDIARITVLKGSETAMYGARGASGVIVITTKKK